MNSGGIMDFELNHMDIVSNLNNTDNSDTKSSFSNTLDDLSQQIDDLQSKLKLSYRKLFTLENENKKLLQEKNYYFYEFKSSQDVISLNEDKLKSLESALAKFENELKVTLEKNDVLKNINETQKNDIIRFSKFHTKIKTVIKPQIQKMKEEQEALSTAHSALTTENERNKHTILDLNSKINILQNLLEETKKLAVFQKNEITQAYEEQIHHLSKEIIDYQNRHVEAEAQILRLKKQNETKNFIENELIKFKRIQDENTQSIQQLESQAVQLKLQNQSLTEVDQQQRTLIAKLELDLNDKNQQTESLRLQLSRWIEENEELKLRLKMFEKLNLQLSQSIQDRNP